MTLANILIILEQYKYLVIFPIMIIEGPIISVISGFMIYLGFLNAFIIYPLLVFGDLIGDSTYYAIGKYCKEFNWVKKLELSLGYDEKSEKFLKNHFENHTIKTLIIAKMSHGFGIPVQITAGMVKVKFFKYISAEIVGTMPKTLILLVIGFYLGDSYKMIDGYFDFIAFVVISILVLTFLYLILNKYIKSYFK